MAYVYAHLESDTGNPFYIGMGRTERRPKTMHDRSVHHKNKVAKHGVRIEIITKDLDWDTAQWWEKRWIKCLNDLGYNLVNLTPGGDGGPTWIGKKHSEETKAKMSAKAMGNKGRTGQKLTAEHGRKVAISQMGNKRGIGHKMSNEQKLKYSFRASWYNSCVMYQKYWGA